MCSPTSSRRILYSIPVLIVSTFLSFVFVSLAGDPVAKLRGEPAPSGEHAPQQLAHQYHLDQSIPSATGTGSRTSSPTSSATRSTLQPIWPDIPRTIGHTAQVIIIAELLALVLGVAVGIFSAIRQYSIFDYMFTSLSFLGYAMPTFWLALLLQILFVDIYLKWHVRIFYTSGLNNRANATWSLDRLQHIALPVTTLIDHQLCALQPLHAGVDARRHQQRLRAHRAGEGPARVARDHAPRLPQRADPDRHRRRAQLRRTARRRDRHRDGLHARRDGLLLHPEAPGSRTSTPSWAISSSRRC